MRALVKYLFVFLSACNLFAQDNPLAMNGYMGFTTSRLNISHKGFEQIGNFNGLDAHFGGMSWSFLNGSIRQKDADSTIAPTDAFIFKVGYRLGKDLFVGSNSFTSFGIKPYVQIFGSYATMPNKHLNNGKVSSAGLMVSPGLEVKLSHLHVALSYDAGLFVNTSFFGGNSQHNLAKGFIGALNLSIGLDNSFDLLTPEMFTISGYDVKKTTTVDENIIYDKGERYREIVTTVQKTYTPAQRSLLLVSPFFGIGPRYSYFPTTEKQNSTSMLGVTLGFRLGMFNLDVYYEEGDMGLKDFTDYRDIVITYPQLRNYNFASSVEAQNYGVKLGIDIFKEIVTKLNFQSSTQSKKERRWKVSYTRLNVFYTYGFTDFLTSANFRFDDASERLPSVLLLSEKTPSADTHPSFLPESGIHQGWGASLELGSVFFTVTNLKFPGAESANHLQYTVGSNIPLGRLVRSAKVRYLD